jgi:GDP-4-dehydro-6-deoxy-D-mannose reductase
MGPILITGATGLIGRAVVPALRGAGPSVVTAGLISTDVDEPGHDLAVEAYALVNKVRPAVIVHLAGGAADSPSELYRKNVLTTINVMQSAARLRRPPYVVLLGSSAEYGEGSGSPLTEQSPLAPVSEYGRAKLAQTTVACEIAERDGIDLTVVRPFNVVAKDLPVTTALGRFRHLMLEAPRPDLTFTSGRLDVVRDYVALDTIVSTLAFLVENRPQLRAVNVCSGIGIALGQILWAMASELHLRPRFEEDPTLMAQPAADCVVGDPSLLSSLIGAYRRLDAQDIARIMLGRSSRVRKL